MDPNSFWSPYQGGVSLTFDDGTQNQLEMAIPLLDEFGFKSTFYLNPGGDDWSTRLKPWKVVAEHGHEIGNHTLTHPCQDNILGRPGGLEEMTLGEIEEDILGAQDRLASIAPHSGPWTFAYPCYATFVGRGSSRQSYVPLIARHFLAGRALGEYGFGNDPAVVDLACAWGLPMERMSGYEMIGLVEEITSQGQWAILVFHEVNGSRLTVGSHDLRMLLSYLDRQRKVIWTAPVVKIANKIAQSRERQPHNSA